MDWPPPGWRTRQDGPKFLAYAGPFCLCCWRDEETEAPRFKLSRIRTGDWADYGKSPVDVIGVFDTISQALQAHNADGKQKL